MNYNLATKAIEVCSPVFNDEAADSLQLYDEAASLVQIGAWSCDLRSERLAWTCSVFDIFGMSPGDFPDRRATLELYNGESRELLERKRATAIATCSGFSLDARIIRPDGIERCIRITAATQSSNGRAERLYGMKQDITEDDARWQRLRAQAECDPLTGVANRARFQRFLDQPKSASELNCIGGLLLFDLDGFKKVNDWWGHAAGDACLAAFAERLRRAFPRAHLVSRIGGDEFAVLLPPIHSRGKTEAALRSLIHNLVCPVPWDGDLLPLGASAGLAFVPEDAECDPQMLFLAADRALYNAKGNASSVLVCA